MRLSKNQCYNFFKSTLFCLILFFNVLNGYSQQQNTYNLLWKISGNGLTKPSFLFGTMHVKDNQAFNFSDSVMLAISQCSSFALEVHPDTLIAAMLAEYMVDKKHAVNFLTDNQYKTFAERFEQKNGFPLDSASASNPLLIKSIMESHNSKKDDKPTFVDAYLLGIARTLKKDIFGLEKSKDQMNLIYGANEEEFKGTITSLFNVDSIAAQKLRDKMIEVYSRGNIYEVENFFGKDDDFQLVERNQVMSASIINKIKKETAFIAIGVAHLPGDEGVIELLRKAGYNLTPVKASFTGIANKYQIDYSKMNWYTHKEKYAGFSLDIPSSPVKFNYNGLELFTYADIINEVGYGITSNFIGPLTKGTKEIDIINEWIKKITSEDYIEVLEQKELNKFGIIGKEVLLKKKNSYFKYHFFYVNQYLVCFYLGNTKESLNQVNSNRFFNSFKVFKPEVKLSTWVNHKDEKGAYSIQFPEEPKVMDKEVEVPNSNGKKYVFNMLNAVDQASMTNYLFRYNDYPVGNYVDNKEKVFEGMIDQFKSKGKLIGDLKVIWKDGYEGREAKIVIEGYTMLIRIYLRGNRIYLLLAQNLNAGETEVKLNNFFNSFRFISNIQPSYIEFKPKNLNFKISVPGNFKESEDADSYDETSNIIENKAYFSVDDNSGTLYGLEYSKYSKYFKAVSIDSLYNKYRKALIESKDSVFSINDVNINDVLGKEFVVGNSISSVLKKYRLWFDNGKFYCLTVIGAKENIDNITTTTYFNSFTKTEVEPKFDLYASKAKLITSDLLSTDTTVYKAAKGALGYYEFIPDELPVIYAALDKKYNSDTTYNGARAILLNSLRSVNDKTTLGKLKELFTKSIGLDIIKAKILNVLPEVDNRNGFETYFNLLTTSKPLEIESTWQVFSPLNDSLSYAATHLDKLLPLIKTEAYRNNILEIANNLLNSNNKVDYYELVKSKGHNFFEFADIDLKSYNESDKKRDYKKSSIIYNYLELMSELQLKETADKFTTSILKADTFGGVLTSAISCRIRNDLSVDQPVLIKQLDSLSSRYEILEALNKVGKLNQVDDKYTKSDEFARLCLFQYLVEDYDSPLDIKLLSKINEQDDVYYVFEFTYKEEGEDIKKHIGVVGPYKTDSKILSFESYNAYSDWQEKQEDWETQARTLISTLKGEE